MTTSEKNEIISGLLSAIRASSKTISQLTPVTELADTDCLEVSEGKKIAFSALRVLFQNIAQEKLEEMQAAISGQALTSVGIESGKSSATLKIVGTHRTVSCTFPIADSGHVGMITPAILENINSAKDNSITRIAVDVTATQASVKLKRSTGDYISADLPASTKSAAGVMSATDKSNLDAMQSLMPELAPLAGSKFAILYPDGTLPESTIPDSVSNLRLFAGFLPGLATVQNASTTAEGEVVYDKGGKRFVLKVTDGDNVTYYGNFTNADKYALSDNKLYLDIVGDTLWRYDGDTLVELYNGLIADVAALADNIDEHATDIADLQAQVKDFLNILPFAGATHGIITVQNVAVLAGTEGDIVWHDGSQAFVFRYEEDGAIKYTSKFAGKDLYNPVSETKIYIETTSRTLYAYSGGEFFKFYDRQLQSMLERISSLEDEDYTQGTKIAALETAVEEIKSNPIIGNDFNATATRIQNDEKREVDGGNTIYDTLESAIAYAVSKNAKAVGMGLLFATENGKWKTYKYTGTNTDDEYFTNTECWLDTASMNAGDEDFLNINRLCGHPSSYGDLAFAVADLIAFENKSGITYRKPGLVVEYRTDDQTWEMKKFVGNVDTEFQNSDMWEDVGSGTTEQIVAKDVPEENGTDAFSTGGAYNMIPVAANVIPDGAETNITFLNSAGKPIFDPITIVSTGGGSSSGVSMGIVAEKASVYAALGTPMIARFAIRSATITPDGTAPNSIQKIEIIDRDTNQTVYSWSGSLDSASSLDKEVGDYNFSVDLQDIFSTASVKRLQIVATDENGKTASRVFQATAEDVTISCRQPLTYNGGNNINPNATSASFDCYQFANTTSAVTAYVDMLIDGEWVNIHTKLLNDNNKNHTKSITFNPQELGLKHGAYQIRMYGVSLNSGVKGNTVYSTVFVVEEGNDSSMVGLCYDDANNGEIQNFDRVYATVFAYKPNNVTGLDVSVTMNAKQFAVPHLTSTQTQVVVGQVIGYETGDTITLQAALGNVFSPSVVLTVNGSAVDVSLKENAAIDFDFASRSNSESDHSIISNGVTMQVNGANWSTNGFVSYLGETAMRFAENVTGNIPLAPFGSSSIETNGIALQMAFATDNIADSDALLFDCTSPSGVSVYVKGNEIGVSNGQGQKETRRFECGVKHTMQLVAEPGTIYEERFGVKYGHIYLYLDGEKISRLSYTPGANPSQLLSSRTMDFDGTHGDFYLYNLTYWNSYFEWSASMSNYLAKLKDVDRMIREFEFENVLRAQTAEEVQMMRPQIDALLARGIACVVLVGSQEDFDRFDSDVKTNEDFYHDVYYFDPVPWRSWIGRHVRVRRQGTTSAKRPKKNDRLYLNKATSIEPMYPDYAKDHELTTEQLLDLQTTYALYALKYVRVNGSSIPVQVITIKIDFSDSTGANDSGTCNMINATFRSLAQSDPMFLTPAQRAFDGTWDKGDVHLTGLQMNHSTANVICAVFRSVDHMQSSYFEAKGNFKEDKGEQVALGFVDTPGYNLGCKNWQAEDFVAIYGNPGETLDQIETRFKAMSDLDTDQLYLLQPYCSRNYRFMRYKNGAWAMSPGSMKQVNGKWVVEGDVLNPVNGWEMLNYTGMNWCQGISSVDDLMHGTTEYSSWVQKLISGGKISDGAEVPAWTYYFECMVDNDDLALAYAQGKVVPFELYQFLRFTDAADYASKDNWKEVWRDSAWKYISLRSNYVTRAAEDYNSMRDSVSKNKQPMAFLEDGHCVINGVYDPEVSGAESASGFNCEFGITDKQSPFIIYFNKVYDIDGANDKDNDGGGTGDPEEDPDKPTDTESGYINTYAGWGSVLFKSCVMQDEAKINANGDVLSYRATVKAMRSCQTTLEDGSLINPFSPEGAIYYYVTSRTKKWPKQVSSYDGWRKYEQYTATSDALYFYALQGLGLASIPQYIKTRWRFRDGFYATGGFFSQSGYISGRIEGPSNGTIRVTAAKSGYFGIGNDSPDTVTERVYLEAGQSYEFSNFRKDNNALIFIYQADRLSKIDISDFSLSDNFDFSHMSLVQEIKIGSDTYVRRPLSFAKLTTLNLGSLPFLKRLDIRNTEITSVNAEGCPRLEQLQAENSDLATLTLAPTSPIDDVTLPDTMTELRFVGLPSLSYPGGLVKAGFGKVSTVIIRASPNINAGKVLADIVADQTTADANGKYPLAYVSIEGAAMVGDGSELLAIIGRGVQGLDGSIINDKPVIRGEYSLNTIIENEDVVKIENGIEGITLIIDLEAYMYVIREVINAELSPYDDVEGPITAENVGTYIQYFNGETAEEYIERTDEQENTKFKDYISTL